MTRMDRHHRRQLAQRGRPGVERIDVKAVNRSRTAALRRPPEDLSQARARPLPHRQVAGDGGHARHLLRAALAALGSRARPARPGRPARHGQQPLLLFLPRDLAAGVLLHHRPAGAGGAGAVPRHVRRRPRLVRLHLSADGLDRSHGRGRALLAGRPQRPHRASTSEPWGAGQALQEGHDAPLLAADRPARPAARSSSTSATRRRSPASSSTGTAPAIAYLFLGIFTLHHLPARRHRPRAGLHLHVPLAAHPGRHVRPRDAARHLSRRSAASRAARTRRARPGRAAATASTARPASPSARPASTSATARSSSASSARCASTPATTS